jgi:hypothetical protein
MVLNTSMMVVIRDCFFLLEDLLIPLLDMPCTLKITKWINIKRARRQVSVEDMENCFNEG